MSNRFKMNFNTNNYIATIPNYNNNLVIREISPAKAPITINKAPMPTTIPINNTVKPKIITRAISLRSPMIDRVHKAKPGCSACGKRVA